MNAPVSFRQLGLVLLVLAGLCASHGRLPRQAHAAATCAVPGATYATIQSAVDDPACDIVAVAPGSYYERLTVQRPVTIRGAGPEATVVNGIAGGSVFTLTTTAVTLSDLSITNGSAQEGGGIYNSGSDLTLTHCRIHANHGAWRGGGLLNLQGSVTISNCTFEANDADIGAALFSESGTVTLSDSVLRANSASGHAGGFYNAQNSTAVLLRVSVQDNTCQVDGGGIFNYGTMTVDNSAIHGNVSTGYSGGGMRNEGTLYINNSTISGNRDGPLDGSGISNWFGTLRLNSVTLSDNDGSQALFNVDGNVRIQNSILSGNPGFDCHGTIYSDGYNLVSDTSTCDFKPATGDILNTTAVLGPLAGQPAYHPLLLGPGINSGNPAGCTNHLGQLLETDQRGLPRVDRCDMGAFEYQGAFYQAFLPLLVARHCGDYVDDFSNPSSGWPVGEDAYVRYAYLDGEYQVRSKRAGYAYLFASPACKRDDYVAAVDVRWAGEPGMAYGLLFDIVDNFSRYYAFGINVENQVFWLDYNQSGSWLTLVPPQASSAIHTGQATNQLQITRDGDQIVLAVNGQALHQFADSRVTGGGRSGIFMLPYPYRDSADARFDNFASRSLPTPGRLPAPGQ